MPCFLFTAKCRFSTESVIQLNKFTSLKLNDSQFYLSFLKPHSSLFTDRMVNAETFPSGPLKLFGRPQALINFMISMFLNNTPSQEETNNIASSKVFKE